MNKRNQNAKQGYFGDLQGFKDEQEAVFVVFAYTIL